MNVSRDKSCRSADVMVHSAKSVDASGEITQFAPDALLPFSRNTDGILGSLGIERLLIEGMNA